MLTSPEALHVMQFEGDITALHQDIGNLEGEDFSLMGIHEGLPEASLQDNIVNMFPTSCENVTDILLKKVIEPNQGVGKVTEEQLPRPSSESTIVSKKQKEIVIPSPVNMTGGSLQDKGVEQTIPSQANQVVELEETRKRERCQCEHTDMFLGYKKLDLPSFYTVSYLKDNPFAISKCTGENEDGNVCGLSFSGPEYVVGTTNPVFACAQAQFIHCECTHALCKNCYKLAVKRQSACEATQPVKRKLRRTTTVQVAATNLTEL